MTNLIAKNRLDGSFETERRISNDRRQRSTRALSRYSHGGKRQLARRGDDHRLRKGANKGYYIDKYEPKMLVTILSILLLSLADAYLTTLIIAHGGEELNILMDMLIKESIFLFIIGKYAITASCLIFLLVHRNFHVFGNFKVTHALSGLLFLYIVLIAYEIAILKFANLVPAIL